MNEISQVDFKDVTKPHYPQWLETDIANQAPRSGYGDCCPSCAGRSSLGLRLRTARLWQIKVNRTIKDLDGFPGFLAAARLDRRRINTRNVLLAGALTAALVVANVPLAHGQDAPAAPQTPSSSTAAPDTPPAASSSSSSSAAPASTGQATSGKEPVCFKLTGHCVDSSKAAGPGSGSGKSGAPTAKTANGKKLNLTAPDVSTVVPEQELKEPLPNPDQVTEVQESQTVAVKTNEGVPTDVPGGLGAIWWAVVHPSQAWRIVTPAE